MNAKCQIYEALGFKYWDFIWNLDFDILVLGPFLNRKLLESMFIGQKIEVKGG